MQCPKCLSNDSTLISNSHYICNNPNCVNEDGSRVQFKFVTDNKIHFPYNQIFPNKQKHEFYNKPYLKIKDVSTTSFALK